MSEMFLDYSLRLGVALLIGTVVGLEREVQGKPAGLRTNILMCLGACLIMMISMEVARLAGKPADPGRIAAQVVTGVGFLCAGTIMRSRFSVTGLTTAATIWVLSALGLAAGAGIGERRGVVVEQVGVARARGRLRVGPPPARPVAGHGVHVAVHDHPHPVSLRCPHREVSHAPILPHAGRTSRATG